MSREQLERGVEQFNGGYYFECHDTLEELWHETRGPDRLFLQGLIQISAGFYHLRNRNFSGAASQMSKGIGKLESYPPIYGGIDLQGLIRETSMWMATAERERGRHGFVPEESGFPRIKFS